MNSALETVRRNNKSTFQLNITSLIDMFTLILVFLLKSYSSSAVDLAPSKEMALPQSTSMEQPVEALKLVVSKTGIFVDDKNVVEFVNGDVPKSMVDQKDDKFIQPLFSRLDTEAKKSKDIASKNETVKFEGKLIFQADQSLSYQLLRKVMYTATIAGYSDFKFAVIQR